VTVAFGLGLILLLLLLARILAARKRCGRRLSRPFRPAMVFYSRYYIHEMLLVFFTAWTFICAWRCANSGRAAGPWRAASAWD
jgi:predicted membrane-bound mannosyltransferase